MRLFLLRGRRHCAVAVSAVLAPARLLEVVHVCANAYVTREAAPPGESALGPALGAHTQARQGSQSKQAQAVFTDAGHRVHDSGAEPQGGRRACLCRAALGPASWGEAQTGARL